jgi:hypothetical protein
MPEDNIVDPFLSQPKLNSGEVADPPEVSFTEPPPARAVVKRKPGQEPAVVATPVVKRQYRKRTSLKARPCCPQGHAVEAAMKFCPECGSECVTAGQIRCSNGHEVPPDAKFCATCGAEMHFQVSVTASGEFQSKDPSQMTEAELRTREQMHQRAIIMGAENPVISYAPGQAPANADKVLIHFLVDGFSAFGNVWYRGQEIEVWPGHPRWREAQSWINLDAAGQYSRYGRQIFGPGPWPGAQSYTLGAGHFQPLKQVGGDGSVAQPTEEELLRADAAERQRGRRVPLPIG